MVYSDRKRKSRGTATDGQRKFQSHGINGIRTNKPCCWEKDSERQAAPEVTDLEDARRCPQEKPVPSKQEVNVVQSEPS